MNRFHHAAPLVLLLLIFWAARLVALEVLPLHNDEGLHLTRAVEVWNLHPFWEIRDGKIINHWLIAAFYPQNAPVFIARFATVLVGLLGLAAGYAFIHRRFGARAAFMAGILWITSPYLFFYERLAFSDAQAGALIVVALWACAHLIRQLTVRRALLTGAALAAAMLFKFTAIPYAALIALLVLFAPRHSLARRLRTLIFIGTVIAIAFIPPVAYLLLRGQDLFTIALGWVGVGNSVGQGGFSPNIARFIDYQLGFGLPLTAVVAAFGLAFLTLRARANPLLVGAALLPLLIIILFGRDVQTRHLVVALPVLLILGGAGVGIWLQQQPRTLMLGLNALLLLVFMPFALHLYTHPPHARLPAAARAQYISDHSSGYALREAVLSLPDHAEPNAAIIASMFPDSCRRANFYAPVGYTLICADAPGFDALRQALQTRNHAFILVESPAIIGIDVNQLTNYIITPIAAYTRPADSPENPSVTLWRVEEK